MSHQAQTEAPHAPKPREIVKDAKGNVGEVMGFDFGGYQLRPVGGGKEWHVVPEDVRECPQEERMQAKLAVANARSAGAL
ncbi:hypothetical protein ACFYXH_02600 [Streptomyces sp. NPDC002730]|uniref:hypothetical protein n=1 Tax=Streptomyces sp. NPDC002730 TaxID=3364662 RepID=UPI0036C9B9B1